MTGKKSRMKAAFMLFIITAGIFLSGGIVLAKTPEFRLDVDSLNMEKGVGTNLVLTVTNAKGAELVDIKGLEDFDVISGNRSTSTRIINGDSTYQEFYNYVILPKTTGQFTLYGNAKYDGNTYQTNELQINVSPANSTKKEDTKEVFVKTLLSSDEVYYGQKVVLAYELYSRYNVENFGFLDSFDINDFISRDVPQDKLKSDYVYLDGNKYVKYEAKQVYLSPLKAGTFTIPAYNFQVNLSTGDFFRSSKPVYLQTNSKELKVKPLPLDNQPASFSGIVGKLNIESQYSKQEVDYGESLTLQVTVSGNCNLEGLNKIIKDDIPGFSVYDTEKNTEESIENNQYKIKKEFEIILVPEKNGDIKIDPVNISYFNPESGSYEQAEIPGTSIMVKGEGPQLQTGLQSAAAPVIETIKIDQVSYKPLNEDYLTIQLKKVHLLIGLAVVVILLILATAAFLLISFQKKHDRKLSGIYTQIKNEDDQNEIYNLFNSMIKYRFDLSLKASSREIIVNRLTGHELASPVLEIMDYMENKKCHSAKGNLYLKEKIKKIYKKLK